MMYRISVHWKGRFGNDSAERLVEAQSVQGALAKLLADIEGEVWKVSILRLKEKK